MPDVVVFGSGALGCSFAARLARAGQEIALAGTWPEALDTIRANGITVEDPARTWTARVTPVPRTGPLPLAPVVLVLVKAYQTEAVAADVRRAAAPDGLVVTLQNGLGNQESLESAPGRGRVVAGVTTAGSVLVGPGRVRAFPGTVVLARDGATDAADAFAHALHTAGLEATAVDDVRPALWLKLAVNCAINPLTALAGVTNGALAGDAILRERLGAAAREVSAVAAARGIDVAADAAARALEVARATAGNRSSMLQDLDHGRPTEIDALSGAVCREGRALGVPTPVNARLWEDVLARDVSAGREARP